MKAKLKACLIFVVVAMFCFLLSFAISDKAVKAWMVVWPAVGIVFILHILLAKRVNVLAYFVFLFLRMLICLILALVFGETEKEKLVISKEYWLWWIGHYLVSLSADTYLLVRDADNAVKGTGA